MSITRSPTQNEQRSLAMARDRLRAMNPVEIARCAGVRYVPAGEEEGVFDVAWLSRTYRVGFPAGTVEDAATALAPKHAVYLLILHYLIRADGYPLAGRWVAYRELPDGLMYDKAVRARTEPGLLAAFGAQPERLGGAARTLGGRVLVFGDAAFSFEVLPRVHLAVILHRGDDEFPAAASVLYDAASAHYLPTDDLSVAGGLLVGALIQADRALSLPNR